LFNYERRDQSLEKKINARNREKRLVFLEGTVTQKQQKNQKKNKQRAGIKGSSTDLVSKLRRNKSSERKSDCDVGGKIKGIFR